MRKNNIWNRRIQEIIYSLTLLSMKTLIGIWNALVVILALYIAYTHIEPTLSESVCPCQCAPLCNQK